MFRILLCQYFNLEKAVEAYYEGLSHWNLTFSWHFWSSPDGWVRFHLKNAKKTLNFSTLDLLATAPTAFIEHCKKVAQPVVEKWNKAIIDWWTRERDNLRSKNIRHSQWWSTPWCSLQKYRNNKQPDTMSISTPRRLGWWVYKKIRCTSTGVLRGSFRCKRSNITWKTY